MAIGSCHYHCARTRAVCVISRLSTVPRGFRILEDWREGFVVNEAEATMMYNYLYSGSLAGVHSDTATGVEVILLSVGRSLLISSCRQRQYSRLLLDILPAAETVLVFV